MFISDIWINLWVAEVREHLSRWYYFSTIHMIFNFLKMYDLSEEESLSSIVLNHLPSWPNSQNVYMSMRKRVSYKLLISSSSNSVYVSTITCWMSYHLNTRWCVKRIHTSSAVVNNSAAFVKQERSTSILIASILHEHFEFFSCQASA